MQIICPECQFAREVDESKIPPRSQVATCPKCQTKFQFRELPPEEPDFDIETPAEPNPETGKTSTRRADQAPSALTSRPKTDLKAEHRPAPSSEDDENESPLFPPFSVPDEKEVSKLKHPDEEIWDKLNDMTPPDNRYGRHDEPQADPHYDGVEPNEDPQQPIPGWNGEFNSDFPDPMEEEQNEDENQQSLQVPPPFEQLDRYGFFHGLYLTIKLVLTSPRLFYSVMPVGGGFSKPLTFTILISLIQTFIQYFWGLAGLSSSVTSSGAEPASGMTGALTPIFMLMFLPALVAASQFFLTGLYHVLLSLMKAGDKGFEGTFRALAYSNTPMILGFFPMPSTEIEMAWMFVAGAWGLFLTILGLKHIHKTSFAKVIPVTLIPLLLGMIGGLLIMRSGMPTI